MAGEGMGLAGGPQAQRDRETEFADGLWAAVGCSNDKRARPEKGNIFFEIWFYSTESNLFWSKNDLPRLEKIKLKYVSKEFEVHNERFFDWPQDLIWII
jgi:hypothetical protein